VGIGLQPKLQFPTAQASAVADVRHAGVGGELFFCGVDHFVELLDVARLEPQLKVLTASTVIDAPENRSLSSGKLTGFLTPLCGDLLTAQVLSAERLAVMKLDVDLAAVAVELIRQADTSIPNAVQRIAALADTSPLKKGSDPLRAFRLPSFFDALQRVRPLFRRTARVDSIQCRFESPGCFVDDRFRRALRIVEVRVDEFVVEFFLKHPLREAAVEQTDRQTQNCDGTAQRDRRVRQAPAKCWQVEPLDDPS
jgi:hypothetical protein